MALLKLNNESYFYYIPTNECIKTKTYRAGTKRKKKLLNKKQPNIFIKKFETNTMFSLTFQYVH